MKDANTILLKHLCQQATQSTLDKLCEIMISAKGYDRMIEFGRTLRTKVSIVGDCAYK